MTTEPRVDGWRNSRGRRYPTARGCIRESTALNDLMTLETISHLVEAFMPHVADSTTLGHLHGMIADRQQWPHGHALFRRIRQQTLDAERRGDRTAEYQHLFEEVCAKTLYNLSGCPAPFDPDTPDWIGPNALALGRGLGIEETVGKILAGEQRK